jgi:hypothetical protein
VAIKLFIQHSEQLSLQRKDTDSAEGVLKSR